MSHFSRYNTPTMSPGQSFTHASGGCDRLDAPFMGGSNWEQEGFHHAMDVTHNTMTIETPAGHLGTGA